MLPRRIGEVTIVKSISPSQVTKIVDDLKKSDPFAAAGKKTSRTTAGKA